MQTISKSQAGQWLLQHQHDVRAPVERLRPDQQEHLLRIAIPQSATEIVSMAYALLTTGLRDDDEAHFQGGLVWLEQWEIWSESIDRIGYLLLKALCTQGGSDADFTTKPGFVFSAHEFAEAHAALAIPMLFQWDAIMAPAEPSFHARISHDGYMDISTASAATRAALLQRFRTRWVQGST
jgi:hypothetical protein